MTDIISLESALDSYKQALTDLKTTKESLSQEQILKVLIARDTVQSILQSTLPLSANSLLALEALDRELKGQRQTITKTIELESWRNLIGTPVINWWWYFEPPALFPWLDCPHIWLERLDWLWKSITIMTLAISATFILNTLKRVLASGLDIAGTFAVVFQSVLTLAGSSALTQQGQNLLESTLTRLRIPKHYWQELGMLLSILFLPAVIAIHNAYLPYLAEQLVYRGETNYKANRMDSAMIDYQQAIALRPDNPEAHYLLGLLYEDLQQIDKAIAEYQTVVQGNLASPPNSQKRLFLLRTHNNLGRLYLLRGNNSSAWIPLEIGLSLVDEKTARMNPDVQYEHYKMLKNLGWVRLQQKYGIDAENWLNQSIKLQLSDNLNPIFEKDGGKAAPYCLRAQVYEIQKQKQKAQTDWETCLQYGRSNDSDEAQWLGMANERLNALEKTKP